eukprot:s1805_g12.t1
MVRLPNPGNGPQAYAAIGGHLEVVQVLLAAGAPVEAKNKKGLTPLHYAACNGHTAIVERLIAAGAVVDAVDDDGQGASETAGDVDGMEWRDDLMQSERTTQ